MWARGLDRRTRSCLTIAILTALRAENELALHLRAALRNGVTPDEIAEVLLHTLCMRASAANAAFAVARDVLAEWEADVREEPQRRSSSQIAVSNGDEQYR